MWYAHYCDYYLSAVFSERSGALGEAALAGLITLIITTFSRFFSERFGASGEAALGGMIIIVTITSSALLDERLGSELRDAALGGILIVRNGTKRNRNTIAFVSTLTRDSVS